MSVFCEKQIRAIYQPTYITPEEDGTMEIEIHTRHFFAADTITEIKAMKTDYGIYQWMQKGKDGQWWPAFQWNDYNDGSP